LSATGGHDGRDRTRIAGQAPAQSVVPRAVVGPTDGTRYERIRSGTTTVVGRADLMPALLQTTASGTAHEWAAAQPDRRTFRGRLAAYAVRLPLDGPAVVVRRNHHGGALARLRGDRFFYPRAARELSIARYLRDEGIATPEVVGIVVYHDSWFSRRSDVITRELPSGHDLGAFLRADPSAADRAAAWDAVASLLHALATVGAWHADLNVKNIHLSVTDAQWTAAVLDVDRITLGEPGIIVGQANRQRLLGSIAKWERLHGVRVSDEERAVLRVREAAA